jgi:hypothetical protein
MIMTMTITVFRGMTSYSVMGVYRHFKGSLLSDLLHVQ